MKGIGWSLAHVASQLLEREEGEAALGDLVEAGESAWQVLLDLLGLIIRRHAALWKNWRPWLAAFGLALPCTLLLMGVSVSVSRSYQQLINPADAGLAMGPGFLLLTCNVLLLVGWSWTGGFVIGSLSRRTLWVSAALCCLPCLFCLSRFRIESLSRLCLFLFLLPAIWGVCRGVQITRIKLSAALVLAVAVTVLTIPSSSGKHPRIPNWVLSWPAWYLVATAQRPDWLSRTERNAE
jgi:hypothetical protein